MLAARKSLAAVVLSAFVAAWAVACQAPPAARAAAPPPAKRTPVDPRPGGAEAALKDPGEFGWTLFLFLSWPAMATERGVPDVKKQIGVPGPTVWETFKSTAEVYLTDGSKPATWNSPYVLALQSPEWAATAAGIGAVDSPYLHYLSEATMIDGRQIVDSATQIVQYDVRMNRDAFEYVVNNPAGYQLFNLEGQGAALNDPNYTFNFPAPALEVKAAWRILESGVDDSRYWTSYGIYTDENGKAKMSKVGLTGLHIISKVLPDWLWVTFEQQDNPASTFQYFEGRPGAAVGANQTFNPAATAYNTKFQADLAGTKWQYYGIQGWQTKFTDEQGAPTLFANTQAETYFQSSSSCITCHSLTSIGPPATPRLTFWNTANGNIQGFTGKVDFQALAKQQYPTATFKQMDYAWSFRNAHSTKSKGARP
jgi:hypothetical protein